MKTTTNYNLNEPETSDTVGVTIPALTANMASIDTLIKNNVNTGTASSNGYIKDKSTGIITQWGNILVNTGGGSHVVFAIPFPTNVFMIMTSNGEGNGNVRNTVTLAGFNIGMAGQSSWIAIGN